PITDQSVSLTIDQLGLPHHSSCSAATTVLPGELHHCLLGNHHLTCPTSFTVLLGELDSTPSCSIILLLGLSPSPSCPTARRHRPARLLSCSIELPPARLPGRTPTCSAVRWSSPITNTCSASTSAPAPSPTCSVVLHHHLFGHPPPPPARYPLDLPGSVLLPWPMVLATSLFHEEEDDEFQIQSTII
ncbi:hypothetical protein Dimus_018219, partial [Dionaea muscipula]